MAKNEKKHITSKVIYRDLCIYTDGAVTREGIGGYGAVIIDKKEGTREIWSGEINTTNNRMELMACIVALQSISEYRFIELYTDSLYVKNGITIWINNWKKNEWKTGEGEDVKNKDLWLLLDAENSKHNIYWKWVRGHSGNKMNERADALAVMGKELAIKSFDEQNYNNGSIKAD